MAPGTCADDLISWLLAGDVAIQYQVYRDLLDDERLDLRARIAAEVGSWPLQARHVGQVHFEMETPGQPSRWNTLRALRVLRHFSAGQQHPRDSEVIAISQAEADPVNARRCKEVV